MEPENQPSYQLSGNPPVHHRSHPTTATPTTTTTTTALSNACPPPPAITHHMLFPQYQRPCSPAFQFLIFLIVAAIVVAGLIAFVVYLVQPHPPKFQIKSVLVSPFAISNNAQMNAVWYIYFTLTNPNCKTRITCEHVEISVYYGDSLLSSSSSTLPSLHLPQDFHGLVAASIPASHVLIANDVANAIVMDWKRGVVKFNFKVRARVVFDPLTLMGKKRWITVICKSVKIAFNITSGSMINDLINCKIDL